MCLGENLPAVGNKLASVWLLSGEPADGQGAKLTTSGELALAHKKMPDAF